MAIITTSGIVGFSEFSYSPEGKAVLIISIADKRWNRVTKEEETEWIRAVWFGERAEKLANSLTKAKIVSVTGKEAYKIYNGKIDRTLFPMEHTILAFKNNEESTKQANNNQTPPPFDYDNSFPPPSDDDIPFL